MTGRGGAGVQRFELGATSLIVLGLAAGATFVIYAWLVVGLLPRLPLPDWPFAPLMIATGIVPALLIGHATTASADVTRDRVPLRVGWRTHDLGRGDLQDVALTTGELVVRDRSLATIRVPITREQPARRLVRALGQV
jgi:putative intracellular protease/amidase